MTKKKKNVTLAATCVVVAVAVVAMVGMAPGNSEPMEIEDTTVQTLVDVQNPAIGDIVVTGEFIGKVEPSQQVTVYPKAAGEVLTAHFSVGDRVEKGDVLLEIDSTTLRNNIAKTQATLANSEAKAKQSLEVARQNLENYETDVEEGLNTTLLTAENAVRTAENALQTANATLRSARRTYNDAKDSDEEYYTDSQIDQFRDAKVQAELGVEKAQLGLESAKATLEATKRSVEEQKESAENNVKTQELNTNFADQYIGLQQLQEDLKDYTVTASIGGIIEQRNIDPYDMVSSQTPVYVISNKEAMTVSFNVSETTLSYMELGDTVTVEKNGETCKGTISEISTMVNSGSGLYTIKATVENAPFDLHSGSTVKLYADTQKALNSTLIPIDAVYYDNGKPYVYIAQQGVSVKTYIETGISDAENIEVRSGLSLGDRVIVTWSSGLMDGGEILLVGEEVSETPETPAVTSESDSPDESEETTEEDAGEPEAADETNEEDTEAETPSSDEGEEEA